MKHGATSDGSAGELQERTDTGTLNARFSVGSGLKTRTVAFSGVSRMPSELHALASVAAQLRPASVPDLGVPTTPRLAA